MSQIEQSVSAILPELVKGRRAVLSHEEQTALARWSVKTILMLQHTHKRSHQIIIPPSDYAAFFTDKAPSTLMSVAAACTEPPGRGTDTEATIQFLAENRDMSAIASLMAQDGGPAPVDMHAYTATLQIGYLVTHVIRIGSPHLIAGLRPSPALGRYALTIWPAQEQHTWPPRSMAEIGGLIALARSLDAGLDFEIPGVT